MSTESINVTYNTSEEYRKPKCEQQNMENAKNKPQIRIVRNEK